MPWGTCLAQEWAGIQFSCLGNFQPTLMGRSFFMRFSRRETCSPTHIRLTHRSTWCLGSHQTRSMCSLLLQWTLQDPETAWTVLLPLSLNQVVSLHVMCSILAEYEWILTLVWSPLTVPAAPRFFTVSEITPNNVTLQWAPPVSIPGLLKEYQIISQLLSIVCEQNISTTVQMDAPEDELTSDCVDSSASVSVNASNGTNVNSITLQSLAKYRYYRFKVAAVTSAGVGEYTHWNYARTLAGSKNITAMIWHFCVARGELAVSHNISDLPWWYYCMQISL